MKILSCPWCNGPLPDTISTEVCTICGKTLHSATPTTSSIASSSETSEPDPSVAASTPHPRKPSHPHKVLSTFARFSQLPILPKMWSLHRSPKQENGHSEEHKAFSIPLTLDQLEDEKPLSGPLQDQISEENDLAHVRPNGELTWQKVVLPSPRRQSYIYPPRPPEPEDERVGVEPRVTQLSQSSSTLRALKRSPISRLKQTSPRAIFWTSTAILLITIGLFAIVSALGQRQSSITNIDTNLSLQITPNVLLLGAKITLRGDHFTPGASVGLTRDGSVPLADGTSPISLRADTDGRFTKTIFVGKDWGVGPHTIIAEDSLRLRNKVVSFPILVDGLETSLPPPLLHLSVNTLDFGVGDQATNSIKTLTLSNGGSNEISWQGSTSEPWLLITPTQGNFIPDIPEQVTVAVDRSKLPPGSFNGLIHFYSNGGEESLTVSAQVVPLQAEHAAVLQVSPAVLSFTATDGSPAATSQQITVTNSGGQAMYWQVSADVPWLKAASSSLVVASHSATTTEVSVASRNLLPGTYTGKLTFTARNSVGDGVVFHSPQQVVVSLTITPPCTLLVTSGMINFSSAYLQPAPLPQTINLAASASCAGSLHWDATSNADWLKLDSTHGATPSTLSVGVDVSGLTPDTYKGTITLSSPAGAQVIVVTLTIGQAGTATISANPTSLAFNSIAGQPGPAPQTVQLANTGDGILNWQANMVTNLNSNWFQVTPTSGTIPAHQTRTLTVTVTPPTALASVNYNGTLSLSGTNGMGQNAIGSPQSIPISYTVVAPPLLVTSPSVIINIPGATSSPVNLANTGGMSLNWSATLSGDAPAFLSLSAPSSSNLAGGATTSFNVVVNANGVASGQYKTSVTINATNAANGQPVANTPAKIPITINIAQPNIQVSTTNLAFSGFTGATVNPQSVTITNSGGGVLSWTASAPTSSWLSISTTTGTTPMGASSTLVFSIQTKGLAASTTAYTDRVVITPLGGNPVTINVSLMITNPPPTPTPMPTATPTLNTTPTVAPTSSATPTGSATPTSSPSPTVTPGPTPTASVSSTAIAWSNWSLQFGHRNQEVIEGSYRPTIDQFGTFFELKVHSG
jgi:Viral BACON domain